MNFDIVCSGYYWFGIVVGMFLYHVIWKDKS